MATRDEGDQALVRRLLAGDEEAFNRFFETYASGLYRFALTRLNRDGDAAEEVVQATLAAAIRKLATFRGEAALFTWLCTFCRHEISAHYRRRRRIVPETHLLEDSPEVRAALESLAADSDRPAVLERGRSICSRPRLEQAGRNDLAKEILKFSVEPDIGETGVEQSDFSQIS